MMTTCQSSNPIRRVSGQVTFPVDPIQNAKSENSQRWPVSQTYCTHLTCLSYRILVINLNYKNIKKLAIIFPKKFRYCNITILLLGLLINTLAMTTC